MVFSTVPHGIVKNINTDSAYNIDGVEKILTCFNTTKKTFCRSKVYAAEDTFMQEQLFPDVVKFVGDRVAMVIAKTPEAAKQGAECIKVEYEVLPSVVTVEAAAAADAPKIYSDGNVYQFPGISCGTPILSDDLIEIDSQISFGALHHGAMETHGCIADYDKYNQKLTIYTPCQSVSGRLIKILSSGICKTSAIIFLKAVMLPQPWSCRQMFADTLPSSFNLSKAFATSVSG